MFSVDITPYVIQDFLIIIANVVLHGGVYIHIATSCYNRIIISNSVNSHS